MVLALPGSARVSWKNSTKQSSASIIFSLAGITFHFKISLEIEIITIIRRIITINLMKSLISAGKIQEIYFRVLITIDFTAISITFFFKLHETFPLN
jgi:hypothetical protein